MMIQFWQDEEVGLEKSKSQDLGVGGVDCEGISLCNGCPWILGERSNVNLGMWTLCYMSGCCVCFVNCFTVLTDRPGPNRTNLELLCRGSLFPVLWSLGNNHNSHILVQQLWAVRNLEQTFVDLIITGHCRPLGGTGALHLMGSVLPW